MRKHHHQILRKDKYIVVCLDGEQNLLAQTLLQLVSEEYFCDLIVEYRQDTGLYWLWFHKADVNKNKTNKKLYLNIKHFVEGAIKMAGVFKIKE